MVNQRTMGAVIRPEYRILLACAAAPLGSPQKERMRSLVQANVDWEYLVWAASGHGLLSLLYRQLGAFDGVPAPVLDDLRFLDDRNRQRSALLNDELHRLLGVFDDAGIVAVPLKGPVLSILAHGDLGAREFHDLDVLIHRRDLQKIKELLGQRGFLPEQELPNGTEDTRLRSCRVRTFVHPASRVTVEVHWELTPPWFAYALQSRNLWKRLVRISLPGGAVWSFAKEDLLLYLCVHGAKHCWERLAWLWDVAALLRGNPDIDWERLLSDCKGQGNERILLLGLALASNLLDVDLPPAIMRELEHQPSLDGLVGSVRHRLFGSYRPWPAALDDCVFHLQVTRRWRDRVSYCLRRTATLNERDWALGGATGSLPVLDYAIRVGRLARKLGRETRNWLLSGTVAGQPSVKANA